MIHVPVHGVVGGGLLLVVVNTAPHAQVSMMLQVLGTRKVFTGTGKHRKKTTLLVTLYQVGTGGSAAKGIFTGRLHVGYEPYRTVQARLSVTVRTGHVAVTHRATVAVLPRYQLLLSPDHGAAGARTLISGRGFTAREVVHIKLSCASATCASRIVLATVSADSHGDFNDVRVMIPGTTAKGAHEVGAIGKRSHAFAWATYTVTKVPHAVPVPAPALTLAPDHGAAGSATLISGHGFAAHETVHIKLSCASAACHSRVVLAAIVTDAHGAFHNAHAVIPAATTRGTHSIGAVGKQSKRFAVAIFTVIKTAAPRGPTPPALLLAPNHGAAGAVTLASGHGFAPHETVRLKLYCSSLHCHSLVILAAVVTGAHGGFSNVRVAIPLSAPRGGHAVGAIGMASNRFAITQYTVTSTPRIVTPPGLALAPDHGAASSTTLASGHGFAPRETVRLKLYCSTPACQSRLVLATVTTDAQGSFSNLRVIIPPKTPRGTHTIGALGKTSKRFASSNFTVTS